MLYIHTYNKGSYFAHCNRPLPLHSGKQHIVHCHLHHFYFPIYAIWYIIKHNFFFGYKHVKQNNIVRWSKRVHFYWCNVYMCKKWVRKWMDRSIVICRMCSIWWMYLCVCNTRCVCFWLQIYSPSHFILIFFFSIMW